VKETSHVFSSTLQETAEGLILPVPTRKDLVNVRLTQGESAVITARKVAELSSEPDAIVLLWEASRSACQALLQAKGFRVKESTDELLLLRAVREMYPKFFAPYFPVLADVYRAFIAEQYPSSEYRLTTVPVFLPGEWESYLACVGDLLAQARALLNARTA
jgi:hypothetical protein